MELRINPMQGCSKLALIAPFPTETETRRARKRKAVCQREEEVGDYHFDLLLLCLKHTPD